MGMLSKVMACFDRGRVPLLMGEPGIGKSAFVGEVGRTLGGRTITLCASHKDPVDIHGVPVVSRETVEVGGRPMTMVVMAPPDWVVDAVNTPGPVLVFWDELTCLTPGHMAPLLDVVSSRVCGGVPLDPNRIAMIAAANPAEMAAGGWDLPPPMANRLTHLQYALDPAEWAERFPSYWGHPPAIGFRRGETDAAWAARQDSLQDAWAAARATVAAYISLRNDQLLMFPADRSEQSKAWPSPRAWDFVSRTLAVRALDGLSARDVADLVAGDVGASQGAEFVHWLNKSDLADIPALFDSPDSFRLPDGIDGQYHIAVGVPAHVGVLHRRTAASNKSAAAQLKARTAAYDTGMDLLRRFLHAGGPKEMAAMGVRTLVLDHKPSERTPPTGLNDFVEILKLAEVSWSEKQK